jgi:UDPglucose 6-dehydrogenase
MNLTIIGAGYVGLATAVAFALKGHQASVYDNDYEKISLLRNGILTIKEEGMETALSQCLSDGRLIFHDSVSSAMKKSEGIFIAVNTPASSDGSADLQNLFNAAESIADEIEEPRFIINKSTASIGTTEKLRENILHRLSCNGKQFKVYVGCNPEFLRAGYALIDCMNPSRIVIGADDIRTKEWLCRLYSDSQEDIFISSSRNAELIKYVSNAFLATKVGFINEISRLCDICGCNIRDIIPAVAADTRIGGAFLNPGPGIGGSCLPKDIKSLVHTAKQYKQPLTILESVINSNEQHINYCHQKVRFSGGNIIAVLGLAFKENTDDIRESYAIKLIRKLSTEGTYQFRLFDPIAMENAKNELKDIATDLTWCEDEYSTVNGADTVVVTNELHRRVDWNYVSKIMRGNTIMDLRNTLLKNDIETVGLQYFGTGG